MQHVSVSVITQYRSISFISSHIIPLTYSRNPRNYPILHPTNDGIR